MKKKTRGQLIVLSGPSGVGKSTVISELLSERKDIYFSVSFTTRQPRVGEADGVVVMGARDNSLSDWAGELAEHHSSDQKKGESR